MRAWLIRTWQGNRTPILVSLNVLTVVIALLIYHALQPAPHTRVPLESGTHTLLQHSAP